MKPIREVPSGAVFFTMDHQGTVISMTDAKGAVVQETAHEAYGAVRAQKGAEQGSYGFVGNEVDAGVGLGDFRARPYRSESGVFLAVDPVAVFEPERTLQNPATQAAFGYGRSSPTSFVDADGRYARITTNGNNVTIVIPIVIQNDSDLDDKALRAEVRNWTAAAAKTWSGKFGKYNVKTSFQVLTPAEAAEYNAQGAGLNVIKVMPLPKTHGGAAKATDWNLKLNDDRKTYRNIQEEGLMTVNDRGRAAGAVFSHEVGHLLGIEHVGDPGNIMNPEEEDLTPHSRPNDLQIGQLAKACNYGCAGK